jgi:MscS family membrane protein
MKELLQQTFLGNTVESYYWFGGIILAAILFKRLLSKGFSSFIFQFLKKYSTGVGNSQLFNLLKRPFELLVLLVAFYFAFDRLNFPGEWHLAARDHFGVRMMVHRLFLVALFFAITWVVLRIVDFWAMEITHKASQEGSKTHHQFVPFMKEIVKVIIALFSVFFMLGTIFHLDITSLIAGLGIGGLAVALAAKESIENLLGSFTIFFDKPFVIGDTIKTNNIEGSVERIGFRSTRIRTTEKSFVTVPNKKLVDSELDNLSLRTGRRVLLTISLSYNTSLENTKGIIADIEKFLAEHPSINHAENRVTLYDLSTTAINIQVLYFVIGNSSDTYLKTRQEVNIQIIEAVNKHGGRFAVTPVV